MEQRPDKSIRRTQSGARFETSRYKDGLAAAGGRPGSITGEQQRRPTGITFTAGGSAEATWCCGARAGAATSGSGSGMRAEASLVSSSSRFREGSMRIARIAPSPSSAAVIVKATV